jgi:hypothetical protein
MMPFHSKAEAANLRPTQFLRTTGIKANAALGIKYHSVLGLLKCHAYFAGLP